MTAETQTPTQPPTRMRRTFPVHGEASRIAYAQRIALGYAAVLAAIVVIVHIVLRLLGME